MTFYDTDQIAFRVILLISDETATGQQSVSINTFI